MILALALALASCHHTTAAEVDRYGKQHHLSKTDYVIEYVDDQDCFVAFTSESVIEDKDGNISIPQPPLRKDATRWRAWRWNFSAKCGDGDAKIWCHVPGSRPFTTPR